MIKIFRRIRKSSLSGNKISKYLLYAIGEILLVVIGIFLAIQFNTWKIDSDENRNVLKYLDGLDSELIQDYERMDLLDAVYSYKTNSIQILLKYGDQHTSLSNNELGKMFNSVFGARKFTNKKSTYLSLINDGYINKIKDKQIINEIIKYYETPYLNWSTEVYGNISQSIDYSQAEIYNSKDRLIALNMNNSIPNWSMNNEEYQTNYEELVASQWAIDALTRFLAQSNFIFINLDRYRELNIELREEIANYKNKG